VAARWFRISFAKNAFLRVLEARGVGLETLSAVQGVRAMEEFFSAHKPQHAELDELTCWWGPVSDGWQFRIARRMQRHGHPVSELTLTFGYTATGPRTVEGQARVGDARSIRALQGYQATRGARARYRRLDQS